MMEQPIETKDDDWVVARQAKCPRCGTMNTLTPLRTNRLEGGFLGQPNHRIVAEIEYAMYQAVCWECGLYFNDAIEVKK